MSLPTWLAAGWLQPHKTSRAEIRELWEIVDRDLADAASGGISADWQYGIAYNAALKLCTILLYAAATSRPRAGWRTRARSTPGRTFSAASARATPTIWRAAARNETRWNTTTPAARRSKTQRN